MTDDYYDPNCIRCRLERGKGRAGLEDTDMCEKHYRAALEAAQQEIERIQVRLDEAERDARRFRWAMTHARWLRHEHEAYIAIPVQLGADLSCFAYRVDAIDSCMREGTDG